MKNDAGRTLASTSTPNRVGWSRGGGLCTPNRLHIEANRARITENLVDPNGRGLQASGNFLFHVDVLDGIIQFTIRQSPIAVPEPSTAMLAGLGLIGLAKYGRGRRRA